MRSLLEVCCSSLVLLLLCSTGAGLAQQTNASLSGSVLDPQGATIANATVTITNVDTAIARTAKTDSGGRYNVTNLNPGHYDLSVMVTGFAEKKEEGILLEVGDQKTLDIPLTLGGASDVITVSATAPVTDTVSSSQGAVIGNRQVVGLPLNQRTFYSLALLTPAAYIPGQSSTLGFRGGFNVSGNNETANTFTINGIDDNDQNVMAPSFRPSVEGIQEFKLLTGVYSAEYGRTSGGQVVVITKTGTNQIHGDLFEFIRNSQFDAVNYFTAPGTPTTFRRNQFGGTIGGPIIKDKAFFFLSYEGLRLAQPVVAQTNVPNPAFQTGDFSSLLAGGNPVQLFYPGTKTPIPGNQIKTGLSPLGVALLKLYPAPNPGQNLLTNPKPTYTFNEKRVENLDEGSARVDYHLTDKDSFLIQYNYFNDPSFEPSNSLCGSSVLPGFGCTTNQISTLAGINYTRIINPNWLNEFRIGFDRLEQPRTGQDVANGFQKIPGAFNDPGISSSINGGAPYTAVSGYPTLHPYTNLPQHRWDNHYNLVDNVSFSHGKHEFKFGANLLQARYADLYVADGTGVFTYTASNANGAQTTGNSAADLALGLATTSTRSPTAPNIQVHYNSLGGYVQDDWKVSPKLTLNLGLRYEYFSPVWDAHDIIANYVLPSAGSPAGNIRIAGLNGAGQQIYAPDLNNFGPRIGLAYLPFGNDKTVVHAAYGLYYNSPAIGNGVNLAMGINPPFRLVQSFTSVANAQIQLDTNPFPNVVGSTPDGSQAHPYQNVSPSGLEPNARTLYMDQFGADIQQQLTRTLALTIGYIGNEGVRIPRDTEPNQGVVTNATATSVTSVKPINATAGPIGPNSLYYQWGNIFYYVTSGHSSYNALTVKAQQAYANGLSFLLAYTWGKAMDNAPGYASGSQASSGTPQDSHNLRAERGLSDFNVGQRLVISPVYELPFGKNKAFVSDGLAAKLFGGFQLSGIYSFDTGRPFTIYTSTNRSGSIYGADRPNLIGNPNTGPRTVAQWFNTAAYTANAYGQFGSAGRNSVIGPTYSDLDIAVQRDLFLSDRYSLQLRAESFDVLNHPNFLNPLGNGSGEYVPTSSSNPANSNSLFGKLTAANDPRSMQFSMKVVF